MLSFLSSFRDNQFQGKAGRPSMAWLSMAWLWLVLIWSGCMQPVQAQTDSPDVLITTAPAAGTIVRNRAFVTFETEGQPVRIDSNEVTVGVTGLPGLTLVPNIERRVTAGSSVALAHRLTNTGNIATAYTLSLVSLTGDSYDLGNLQIIRDANGNGTFDAGEIVIAAGQPIYLSPGESADLVVIGGVPTSAAPDSIARTRLTATVSGPAPGAPTGGDFSPLNASVVDVLTTVGGATLSIRKSASTADSTIGSEITFNVVVQNSGTLSPLPQTMRVDGAARSFVLIRDLIPANTTFVELLSSQVGATRLYHRAGDAVDSYLSLPPTASDLVDAVAVGVPSIAPNSSVSMALRVRVGGAASGAIFNTARVQSIDPVTNNLSDLASNQVQVNLPAVLPTLEYYTSTNYGTLAGVTTVGRPLYLQGAAGACNLNSGVAESVQLSVSSKLTGDSVTYTAVETGPNTGVFRVTPPIPTSGGTADNSNAILEIRPNDELDAILQDCGGARALADILVDPFGVVFDSRTNEPVAGARVTLIDVTGAGNGGNAGGPARVLDVDATTPLSAVITTGADGAFRYPLVAGSTYRLDIVPPAGYDFPSKVSVFLLPARRRIDPSGSYGGSFRVDEGTGAVQIDVPLDPPPPAGLFLQKIASRRTADIADFVDYEIRLRNTTGALLSNIFINDVLPRGFSLVGGSVRRGGAAIPDPQGAPGSTLRFDIGNVGVDGEVRLTYRVRLGAGVASGDQVNRAQATGTALGSPVTSNTASAPVRVSAGLLTERAILFGKVFVDSNKNRIEDKGEPGVPGVRVWIEDGTYAITDSDGKYSLYGLSARVHVVKVDRTTLPATATFESLTVRHGGRGESAFADLIKGEMHKVNFALVDASPALLELIEKRRAAGDPFNAEVVPTLQGDLRSTTNDVLPDSRSLPATGTMGAAGPIGNLGNDTTYTTLNPGAAGTINTSPNGNNAGTFSAGGNVSIPGVPLNAGNSNLARPTDLLPPRQPLTGEKGEMATGAPSTTLPTAIAAGEAGGAQFEAYLKDMDNTFAVLTPQDGAILPLDQANIRIKGRSGAKFVLRVNGKDIPESRVGARLDDTQRDLQAWEYVGVRFKAGDNLIEAAQADAFGNERDKITLHVKAPGSAGKLILDMPKSGSADGVTPLAVTVRIVDEKGVPVSSRTPVTLETASGRFDIEDLDSREPGTQVFVEGGSLKVDLLPPAEPGDGLVRAFSGTLETRTKLSFLPELRPLIAVGTLEGGVNFFNFSPTGVSGDLFRDDTKGLFSGKNGDTSIASRAALFLKGRVLGKNLLTLRYDSQSTKDRLFRDIQPDEYYPVYGDGALKGFDAQSTGRLYVRLDRQRNYFLYGDFTTASTTQFNTLANYQRALNGGRQHLENDKYSVDFFAARDSGRQIVDEIRANGTSGGYVLRSGGYQENSERVEIIVRDRNNSGVILEVRPQTRFTDYEFDSATGRILFRSPVLPFDANFNPVYIRVFSSVETGGPRFWVQGFNGAVKITPNLEIGGSVVRDADPQDSFNMQSLNATYKLGDKTTISGELARTDRDSLGSGSGSRLEVLHDSERLQARFFAGRTSTNFDNTGSILSRGRGEISLRATWRLNGRTRLLTEALRTSDTSLGNSRTGIQASIEREFARGIRAEIGVRRAKEDAPASLNTLGATPIDFTSLRARLTVPTSKKTSVFGEYESDISDSSRRVLAAGGEYRLTQRSRLYARHEFISSLDGRYALNDNQEQQNTIFGLDTSYSQSGRFFSEYRMRGALAGREGQAALGLRDTWEISEGLRVNGGFERTKSMGNSLVSTSNDSTALTGGVEYTKSENFKGTSRLELRRAANSDGILGTLGVATRLNKEVTLLSRGVFNLQKGRDGNDDAAQHRFQLGMSYRDRDDDRWSGLAKYEFRQTKNGTSFGAILPGDGVNLGGVNGSTHLLSADANYQKSARLVLSGHYGAKFNSDKSNGLASKTWAQLLSMRAIYELNRKTEVSAQTGALYSKGGGVQYGWGAELGRLVGHDLWLSAGYNFGAVSDGDLTGSGFTRRGPYLRIRFKFDESLFGSREAQLLAQSDKTAKTEAKEQPEIKVEATPEIKPEGTRTVDVPVVAIDPQTQEKTELPVTATVTVDNDAPNPTAVVIDAPEAPAAGTPAEAVIETPLNPRIVDATGAQWKFEILPFGEEQMMRGFYNNESQARRSSLLLTSPGTATVRKAAAPATIKRAATRKSALAPTFKKVVVNKVAPRNVSLRNVSPAKSAAKPRAVQQVRSKVKVKPEITHDRRWWLK